MQAPGLSLFRLQQYSQVQSWPLLRYTHKHRRERQHMPQKADYCNWGEALWGEGERKKGQPQKCLSLMVNICPPPFRMAWDSLYSRDLLRPKIRSASSQNLAARAAPEHQPWRSCGACSGHTHTPRGAWMKSGQTCMWETCKREGRAERVNATLTAPPPSISPEIFHSLFKKES